MFPVLGVCTLLSVGFAADEVKEELARLDGEWRVVALESSGASVPADRLKDHRLVIKGDAFVASRPRDDAPEETVRQEGTLTVDPTASPRTLDIVLKPEGGLGAPRTQRAIYKLEGDRLIVCSARPGGDRPSGFDGKARSVTLMTLTRGGR
jgi:uncharacterized protein (TIGR03067 family)